MMSTDVIIGMAVHYDFELLAPFVRTLRRTGYQGDVVFLYREMDAQTLDRLRAFGVTLVPIEPSATMAVYCQRYPLVHDYLTGHPQYERMMLSDTRDVIFHVQPFDLPMGDEVCYFQYHERMTIGDTPIN